MEGVRGLHTSLHPFCPSQHIKQLHLEFSKQVLFPQSLLNLMEQEAATE